jgi:hypothetical protein
LILKDSGSRILLANRFSKKAIVFNSQLAKHTAEKI